ncbi:MAG: M15 family metallopeptidase [Clostridium sp.]|uniref:M15 family metallopeptidase n=1 Tax=Clostridium sp. TaxID=1506 RepID=UPI0025B9A516|nr:M15 family metallopeptidase [Clostridium sp.]MCF0149694.1 M15 family metallopeptidase [Clostridium sp.]
MKKRNIIFAALFFTLLSPTCYIESKTITQAKGTNNFFAAITHTGDNSTVKDDVNNSLNTKIKNITKFIPHISFSDILDKLNNSIDSKDITNSTILLNNINTKIAESTNHIKENFNSQLHSEIQRANGLTDDYLEKLINDTKTLIACEDFEKINAKMKLISYKIDNLLYESGQTSTLEPLEIDGTIIVNKNFGLPVDYGYRLRPEVDSAFQEMKQAAANDGVQLSIASGFRSYYKQQQLFSSYSYSYGSTASSFSAPAGYSEHQSGLALDIGGADSSLWVTSAFSYTYEAQWLKENCAKYGFILRYPVEKEDITGYIYESWHFRYVGTELSTYLTENNLTLEEHFGL